jgi:hypothetical protein
MKAYTLAALLFLTLPAAHGQSATQTTTQEPAQSAKNAWLRLANNGAWWNAQSPESKSDFIDGYVSAMAHVHKMLMAVQMQNATEMTPGPKVDGQMSAIIQLSAIAEAYEFEEVGRAKLLSGMGAFYKEPLNKLIPIDYAFAWERDTLNGKVAPRDLQRQLDEWRTIVNK